MVYRRKGRSFKQKRALKRLRRKTVPDPEPSLVEVEQVGESWNNSSLLEFNTMEICGDNDISGVRNAAAYENRAEDEAKFEEEDEEEEESFISNSAIQSPNKIDGHPVIHEVPPTVIRLSRSFGKCTFSNYSCSDLFCFVCWRNVTSEELAPTATSSVYYPWFLKGILEMDDNDIQRESVLEGLLKNGHLGMCLNCISLMDKTSNLKRQISVLQQELDNHQKDILITLKGASDTVANAVQRNSPPELKTIAKYVKEKNYDVLTNYKAKASSSPSSATLPNYSPILERSSNSVAEPIAVDPLGSEQEVDFGNDNQSFPEENANGSETDTASSDMDEPFYYRKQEKFNNSLKFTYNCAVCPKIKNYSVDKYAQHLLLHQRRPYRCKVCFEFLPNDADLQEEHWKSKHADQEQTLQNNLIEMKFDPGLIWNCYGCGKGFSKKKDRKWHEEDCCIFKFLMVIKQDCVICKKSIRKGTDWRFHRVIHHPEVDPDCCTLCDAAFTETTVEGVKILNTKNLREHLRINHKVKKVLVHASCDICGIVLNSENSEARHMTQKHDIPEDKCLSCKVCNYTTSKAANLQKHVTNCHMKVDFICDLCGMKFRVEATFNEHKFQEHSIIPEGGQIFTCPEINCNFKAVMAIRMTQHLRNIHTLEKTRPHKCSICKKSFKQSTKLHVHMAIHNNKESKPFQCEVCGASFAVRNYLYIHKRLSHEKRLFPSTNRKRSGVTVKEKDGNKLQKLK